jgi:hypothetical protein
VGFLSNDALPDMLKETLDVNCIKMENGCLVPGPSSALGIKWIKDVWDHIVSRKYTNLDLEIIYKNKIQLPK